LAPSTPSRKPSEVDDLLHLLHADGYPRHTGEG
jgi:hypothetical protein